MICVFQFDSASVALLDRLLADGRLGTLAALLDRGRRVELKTPARDFAAGSFYSLYSGVELGDHGIIYPFQWSAAEQRAHYATAFQAPPAVWERVGEAGKRTLAIDPYECRAPAVAEGVFVSGWGFSDRVVLPRWSRPEAVGPMFEHELGAGPPATEIFGRPRVRELFRLREKLLAAPGRTAALATKLLSEQTFDLTWLTFCAAHLAGHQFWDLSQLDSERLSKSDQSTFATTLEDVYIAVDKAIGQVVAKLPRDADVIVTSAVGMDKNTSQADLLPEMLARVLAGGAPDEERGAGAIWRLRAAIPPGLRGKVAAALPDRVALELTAKLELRGIDWATTRAFAHPADNQGYVRLNLAGREIDGIVFPADADALLDEIATGLRSFRNPDGTPAVEDVVRAQELYPGSHSDRLPDLVVRWSGSADGLSGEVRSPRYGTVSRQGAGSGRSGNHTAGDAWAMLSPGAASLREPSRPPRLVDVAATVCELTGADATGLPGEPLLVREGQPDEVSGRAARQPLRQL